MSFQQQHTINAYFDNIDEAEKFCHQYMNDDTLLDVSAHLSSPTEVYKSGLSLLPQKFYWTATIRYRTGDTLEKHFKVSKSPTQTLISSNKSSAVGACKIGDGSYVTTANPGSHTHYVTTASGGYYVAG